MASQAVSPAATAPDALNNAATMASPRLILVLLRLAQRIQRIGCCLANAVAGNVHRERHGLRNDCNGVVGIGGIVGDITEMQRVKSAGSGRQT